jgi:DNA-binding transcriptional regulator PaaX
MNILKMLEKEEKQMAGRLEGLRAAISALNGGGKVRDRRSGRKKGWHMSEAAKLRISRAQKARWREKNKV